MRALAWTVWVLIVEAVWFVVDVPALPIDLAVSVLKRRVYVWPPTDFTLGRMVALGLLATSLAALLVRAEPQQSCLLSDPAAYVGAREMCRGFEPCRATYFMHDRPSTAVDTADYDERVFRFLYAQHVGNTNTAVLAADAAVCACFAQQQQQQPPTDTTDPTCDVVLRLWLDTMMQEQPCAPNEEFVPDIGCRCRHGARCPDGVGADGVGARHSDTTFVRLFAVAVFVAVVVSAVILLGRIGATQAEVQKLAKRD